MRQAAVISSLLSLTAAGLLAGCPDRTISEVDPLQGRVEAKDIPIKVNRDVDLLFLIDDSPSMGDKQTNLAKNFPDFINVLRSIQGGIPNVHIGVATSDLGSKGADGTIATGFGNIGSGGCSGVGKAGNLQPVKGASKVVPVPYIEDLAQPDGSRSRNYSNDTAVNSAELNTVFGQTATVGAGGCGFEQHLEAVKQALEPNNVANSGFLRDDAYLAVIIIADEDDCSVAHAAPFFVPDNTTIGPRQSFRCTRFGVLCDQGGANTDAMNVVGGKSQCHPYDASPYLTNVAGYAQFLKTLKTDPSKVIVAAIVGATEPFATEVRGNNNDHALAHSCTYVGNDGKPEVADPPIRTKFFLDQFPNRSTFASICQKDLSGGLQQIADLLKSVIGDPCIEGKLKGPPYECSVSAKTNVGLATETETVLPACNAPDATATNQPCWHLPIDAVKCPNSDHLLLKIEGQDSLAQDTHIIANCVTEVTNSTP